jgi:hypothetical protein
MERDDCIETSVSIEFHVVPAAEEARRQVLDLGLLGCMRPYMKGLAALVDQTGVRLRVRRLRRKDEVALVTGSAVERRRRPHPRSTSKPRSKRTRAGGRRSRRRGIGVVAGDTS